jgi:DNA ligase-1
VDFHDLAERMEAIEATPSRLEMAELLADTLSAADGEETPPIAYMLLGGLAPEFEGLEVGLAENRVRELIRTQTGTSEAELDELMAEEGDLGLVAEHLWEASDGGQMALDAFGQREATRLSVQEVHERLSEIARIEGEGSQEKRKRHAMRLADQVDPIEARYLVRFLVGQLRLGVADQTLLDGAAIAYAPQEQIGEGDDGLPRPPEAFRETLERAYNLTSDIGAVLSEAREEGQEGLAAVEITPGMPVRPMLAERGKDAETIFDNVGTPALAEYKYDGLRIQAHVTADEVHLFSRRLEDVTSPYPDVVEHLQEALGDTEAVVEGEAVPVDPETGEIQPFQEIAKRRGRKHDLQAAVEEVPIDLYMFDCLWVDGRDLTPEPVEERRDRLEAILADHEHVAPSHARQVHDPAELDAFFEDAVQDGSEGLMVKKTGEDSHYQAGARGYRWIKYKADYQAELADSMDLVVVGAWHGKGRRAGWYGTLLGAAWDEDEARYKTVCKVGTGFTDEDLDQLDELLGPHQREDPPKGLDIELEPDVFFDPELVAEIHGADLTRSPVHTAAEDEEGGIALRFPRFVRWCTDKGPQDATTVDEVRSMYDDQPGVEAADA